MPLYGISHAGKIGLYVYNKSYNLFLLSLHMPLNDMLLALLVITLWVVVALILLLLRLLKRRAETKEHKI